MYLFSRSAYHAESYLTCQSLVQLCLNSMSYSHTPAWLSRPAIQPANPGTHDDLTESSELTEKKTDKSSPSRSIERLKIRIGDPEPPIQKIKITPEKLAKKSKSKLKNGKSKKRSPEKTRKEGIKMKILTPKSRKILKYTQKKDSRAKGTSPSTKEKPLECSPKKYSFFKSKNSASASKKQVRPYCLLVDSSYVFSIEKEAIKIVHQLT